MCTCISFNDNKNTLSSYFSTFVKDDFKRRALLSGHVRQSYNKKEIELIWRNLRNIAYYQILATFN